MAKGTETLPVWTVVVNRVVFVMAILLAAFQGWKAAHAIPGIFPKWELGFLWLFAAMLGATLWLAPKRGQMTEDLANSLLGTLSFIVLGIGDLLTRLADYAHLITSMGKVLK